MMWSVQEIRWHVQIHDVGRERQVRQFKKSIGDLKFLACSEDAMYFPVPEDTYHSLTW